MFGIVTRTVSVLFFLLILLLDQAMANSCLIGLYKNGFEADIVDNPEFAGDVIQPASIDKPLCGKQMSFLDTYNQKNNIVRVEIAGTVHQLMPLALYRKNKNFKCNRIKVRSACFIIKKRANGTVAITLSDKDTESKGEAEFIVEESGRIEGTYPEYALIKASQKNRNGKIILAVAQITSQVEEFRKTMRTCSGGANDTNCKSALDAVAENWVLERLRYERFPHRLSQSEISDDWKHFRETQGYLNPIQRAIDEIMRRNEAGKTSPYELSDATKGNSGLSFGVRQLDIGVNDTGKRIFRANLAPYEVSWRSVKTQSKDFVFGDRIIKPIRGFSPDELFFTHLEVPQMTPAMRSDEAKARYDAEHKRFLAEEAAKYSKLRQKCGFKKSPILALFAIDRANQTGNTKAIEQIVKQGCDAGRSITDIEAAAIASFGGYSYRAKNIVEISKLNGLK